MFVVQESTKESSSALQETVVRLETEARQLEARQLDLQHEAGRHKEAAEAAAAKYAEASAELAALRKEGQELRTGQGIN
jgi:peptidoglycan hydrolase CwlO-like protein